MKSDQADEFLPGQLHFFQQNPDEAVALLSALKRLLEWEAAMGGWEAKVWQDARTVVKEVESNLIRIQRRQLHANHRSRSLAQG